MTREFFGQISREFTMDSHVKYATERSSRRYATFMEHFGVTSNGFLPSAAPLVSLGGPFRRWEEILSSLPHLLRAGGIRNLVEVMPVLPITSLQTEPELRRAYVVLGFLAQAYIWGDIWSGSKPTQVGLPQTKSSS